MHIDKENSQLRFSKSNDRLPSKNDSSSIFPYKISDEDRV